MHDIIEQLKANRARLDAAIAALTGIDTVDKPRRGRPARKPAQSATEIHIADNFTRTSAGDKVRAATKYAWETAHAAGFKPKTRPSRQMVARAERIIEKRKSA